jgi:protein transport protein SEC24
MINQKLTFSLLQFQIAVDLFALGSQYQDIASLSGMSKFSAGQIQYFPGYHVTLNPTMAAKFECALRQYF